MPTLFDLHNPVPCEPTLRDTHVTEPQEIARLTRQCRLILARLREGPATNAELAKLSLKYTSRISDLRAAGYAVELIERNSKSGVTRYQLFSKEGASR